MHIFKLSTLPILLLVSCKSNDPIKDNQKAPPPIIIEKTDVIRREFPKVEYVL